MAFASGSTRVTNLNISFRNAVNNAGTKVARLTQTATNGAAVDFLSAAEDSSTESVMWQVLGGNVRYTTDGTDPTTTVGIRLLDGASSEWHIEYAKQVRVIAEAANATITVFQGQHS